MPGDSPAGDAAFLGGDEIVNAARTIAYLENGFGPPGLVIHGTCACPHIRELAGCDPEEYSTPADDLAPWFNPNIPESADFAGFYPTEFEGLDSTFSREPIPRIAGGSVIGRQRANHRILTWTGFLFGRTCCAVQYGLRWFIAQLTGVPCQCDNETLDLLVCCPEPVSGITRCAGLPSLQYPVPCTGVDAGAFDAFRSLREVGLFEGPTVLSNRKVGTCQGDCENSATCENESCIIEVEFSLIAGNPFLHGCSALVCENLAWPPAPTGCVEWTKVNPGETCPEGDCPEPADCTEDLDTGFCPPVSIPVIPEFVDNCGCDPVEPVTVCCSIDSDLFGVFFEGAPVIEITSGSTPLRAIRVRLIENPTEADCDLNLDDPCIACDELRIRYVPPNSTLIIDGATKLVDIICPGHAKLKAEHLITAPYSFPTLRCSSYCICLTTEGAEGIPTDATISVTLIPKQM